MIQRTMHPWERDALLVRKSLEEKPPLYNLLIELACTRTSDEFLGARKAFQCLYSESVEEFVAVRVDGFQRRVSPTFTNFFSFFLQQTIFVVYKHILLVVIFENKNWWEIDYASFYKVI